ncbi:hypothetical protein TRFO_18397 [Tritrichomonas foetus]|uniref:Uncharacterized protein n=1 Tax=Tritrichomonas foetus TaxID=1144522 RepID=A0A1J4KL24_9EUKA|nr:hypothetical protein TRFO_18397 [Tritrichomonas foetus]|eukprot:OHT11931.1 hypothetical protein TRFO_18397 [Tritrichomonas foetus]
MGVLKKINYFMYGAGSLFFFVTMLVAAAYSGLLFTDIDHEVGRDTYGRTGSLYSCLLGILVLSLVCCVIFGITFVFSLCNILKCVRVILNFVGVVFFIGVLICEALFVVFYAYQGEPYPDAYAYCKNSDFVEHMSHFSTIYQHCGESGSNSNSINEVSEGENKINALSKKQYLDFTIENLKIL